MILVVVTVLMLGAVGFLGVSGYKTVTTSDFFRLQNVDVQGTERTSAEEVRRIVTMAAEKPGVWHADLSEIRARIEKFPFVKTAAVSMALPSGIRVRITERVPVAIVQMNVGKFLVDGDGTLLAAATPAEKGFPMVLKGWDESKTERAIPDNIARLKVYKKMLDEWQQFDLLSRVKEVDLSNPRNPVAVVEDSSRSVPVTLARESMGKSLKTAIEALSGKGSRVRAVDAGGVYPVLQYLEN